MKALAIVAALAGTASAEAEPDLEPRTHDRLFGFRIGSGEQAIDGRELTTATLTLAVEHRVVGDLRIAAEYEHVWLGIRDTEKENRAVTDGSAHRANLLARYPLYRRRFFENLVQLYVDLELGGGFLLGSEPMAGTIAVPQGLAGFRLGYDFIKFRKETRASAVWEAEVLFRVVGTPHEKIGYLVGIGMAWGS